MTRKPVAADLPADAKPRPGWSVRSTRRGAVGISIELRDAEKRRFTQASYVLTATEARSLASGILAVCDGLGGIVRAGVKS